MSAGTGALFQEDAKQAFVRISGSRFDSMMERLTKKKLIPAKVFPFEKNEFRVALLTALGGHYDGCVECPYCGAYVALAEIAADHAVPIDRGGSIGLDNIEFIDHPCNNRKGKMLPAEYRALLKFLEETLPLARIDVLKRLEMSVKLAASIRSNAGVVNMLKDSGDWQRAQATRRQIKRAKDAGLKPF